MWQYRGIEGGGQPPKCLGKYTGRLIVLGGARCVWADYSEYKQRGLRADIMAVNDVGVYCEMPIQHWVSLHPDNLILWRKLLHNHARDFSGMMHTNSHHYENMIDWHMNNIGAYSGLFAAQVGICLGYQEIILCGVPQDDSGRFFDPPWVKGLTHGTDQASKKSFREAVQRTADLRLCVRSMSGWTRELLGGPDEILSGQLQCSV